MCSSGVIALACCNVTEGFALFRLLMLLGGANCDFLTNRLYSELNVFKLKVFGISSGDLFAKLT